ncbi:MAG: ATP-binding protein [Actinomycetota bacterium]
MRAFAQMTALEVGREGTRRGIPRIRRSATDQILTGTAAGLASSHGLDPNLVRAAFVVLAFAGGFGIVTYGLLALAAKPGATAAPPLSGIRQVAAVTAITFGALIALREVGLWLGDALVWPVSIAALGASVLWVRSDDGSRRILSGNPIELLFARPVSPLRLIIGIALIVVGIGSFLVALDVLAAARTFVLPVLATIAGLSLVFGPWLWRLAEDLAAERRQRIRSEERSEVAAHLHDSVLQTLALIQRADDPRAMSSLARVQERELRNWLYGEIGARDEKTLEGAIEGLAARVESMNRIAVETVVVGDRELDGQTRALVQACGEALVNAAKHSGAASVSLFVEATDEQTVAYVRDEGVGFDLASVPDDRRGIAASIEERMERAGGWAKIVSAPGHGVEVQLTIPVSAR